LQRGVLFIGFAGEEIGLLGVRSDDFGPAVVGILRHHIVVPSWTLTLEDEGVVVEIFDHHDEPAIAEDGSPMTITAPVIAPIAAAVTPSTKATIPGRLPYFLKYGAGRMVNR